MMNVCNLFVYISILLIFYFQFVKCKKCNDKLIFVNTLCRHGDRNILKMYPTDPHGALHNWPGGYGQLTQVGKDQHYRLGSWLRDRYRNLLGNGNYDKDIVHVRTTDIRRVKQSAQYNLAAFFKTNRHIEIHTPPRIADYTLIDGKPCDRYDHLKREYMKKSEYKNKFHKNKTLIRYLRRHSGKKLSSLHRIFDLYEILWIERLKKKRLPSWAKSVMHPNGDFERLALSWFKMDTATTEMKKFRSGYLLDNILKRFSDKVNSKLKERKLWMYFAHDTTIANLLNTLGVFEKVHQPPYASCLIFELYRGCNGPYVKTYYRKSKNNISILHIPGCGTQCALKKFHKIYKDRGILPNHSFEYACKYHRKSHHQHEKHSKKAQLAKGLMKKLKNV